MSVKCSAVDSPVHVTSQRLYKSGKNDDMHKYTLHSDDPDFVRAKVNAQQISDVRQLLTIPDTSKWFLKPHGKMYESQNLFVTCLQFFSHEESLQGLWGASEDIGLWPEAGCYSLPNCQGLQRNCQWREFSSVCHNFLVPTVAFLMHKLAFISSSSCICAFFFLKVHHNVWKKTLKPAKHFA